jgi:hypothetical protein
MVLVPVICYSNYKKKLPWRKNEAWGCSYGSCACEMSLERQNKSTMAQE